MGAYALAIAGRVARQTLPCSLIPARDRSVMILDCPHDNNV